MQRTLNFFSSVIFMDLNELKGKKCPLVGIFIARILMLNIRPPTNGCDLPFSVTFILTFHLLV